MGQVCVESGYANGIESFDEPIKSLECGKNVTFKHSEYGNHNEECWRYYDYDFDGKCALSSQFGSGYYVNKDLYASTEYRIEKSFLDVHHIIDHTQQDGVTFFDQTDCSGPSGTVHFNDFDKSRDPSTIQADRTELNNLP